MSGVELSARVLAALGHTVINLEGSPVYFHRPPGAKIDAPVPDLTLPENLGRVVELAREAFPEGVVALVLVGKEPKDGYEIPPAVSGEIWKDKESWVCGHACDHAVMIDKGSENTALLEALAAALEAGGRCES